MWRIGLVVTGVLAGNVDTAVAQTAAETVLPDAPAIDGNRIEAGIDSAQVHLVRSGESSPGPLQIEELRVMGGADGPVLRQVMRIAMGGSIRLQDTTWYRLPELTPLRHRSVAPGVRHLELRYGDHRIVGVLTPADGSVTEIDLTTTHPVFDPGSSHLLLQAVELREGLAFRVPFFDHQELAVRWSGYRVVAAEMRSIEDVTLRPVWRVEQTLADGRIVTLWVDRDSGEMLEVHTRVGPDFEMRTVGGRKVRAPRHPTSASRNPAPRRLSRAVSGSTSRASAISWGSHGDPLQLGPTRLAQVVATSFATGRPWSVQSGTPSGIIRTRKPCPRNRRTA